MSDTPQTPTPTAAPVAPAAPAQPPAPAAPPAPAPAPATPTAPATKTASSEIDALRATTEAEFAKLRFENQLSRTAATSGVKDLDFFEFLANRERASKGDAFNLNDFVNGLKTSRPELFHGHQPPPPHSQPATPAAGTGTPPNASATTGANDARVAELRTAYNKAVETRNIARMLQILTELQKLGVTA